jgi:hypothetical protein
MCKREREAPPRDGLSQDRSRRRSTLSNYSNKRLTKTDMVVECLEATPHEAVTLPALHSYLQENIARLTATSLTWVHDIKAACDLELAKPTSRIAELPLRQFGGPPAYKLHLQHVLRSATASGGAAQSPRRGSGTGSGQSRKAPRPKLQTLRLATPGGNTSRPRT